MGRIGGVKGKIHYCLYDKDTQKRVKWGTAEEMAEFAETTKSNVINSASKGKYVFMRKWYVRRYITDEPPIACSLHLRHELDLGKVGALYRAHWSIKEIAYEMGEAEERIQYEIENMTKKDGE